MGGSADARQPVLTEADGRLLAAAVREGMDRRGQRWCQTES